AVREREECRPADRDRRSPAEHPAASRASVATAARASAAAGAVRAPAESPATQAPALSRRDEGNGNEESGRSWSAARLQVTCRVGRTRATAVSGDLSSKGMAVVTRRNAHAPRIECAGHATPGHGKTYRKR